jgi:hypothetical protein
MDLLTVKRFSRLPIMPLQQYVSTSSRQIGLEPHCHFDQPRLPRQSGPIRITLVRDLLLRASH